MRHSRSGRTGQRIQVPIEQDHFVSFWVCEEAWDPDDDDDDAGESGEGGGETSSSASDDAPSSASDEGSSSEDSGPRGAPLKGVEYRLTFPDGTTRTGTLDDDGKVRHESVPRGSYRIELKVLSDATWSGDVLCGQSTTLSASAPLQDDGTAGSFEIYCIHGTHRDPIATVDAQVASGRLTADWTPDADALRDEVPSGAIVFLAKLGDLSCLSATTPLLDARSIEVKDADGNAVPGARLVLAFSDGTVVEGTADGDGKVLARAPLGATLATVDLPDPDHVGASVRVELEGESDALEFVVEERPGSGDDGAAGEGS